MMKTSTLKLECTSKLYNIGDKIGALQTTYKDGYIFMGWFYDEKYTNKVYDEIRQITRNYPDAVIILDD